MVGCEGFALAARRGREIVASTAPTATVQYHKIWCSARHHKFRLQLIVVYTVDPHCLFSIRIPAEITYEKISV